MLDNIEVDIRYAADLPVLRYIVPFSYSHNGMSYSEVKKKILSSKEWKIGKRKDLVPSREEDLYDHVYDSLIDDDKGSMYDTNIGMFFIPNKPLTKQMVYSFFEETEKKYEFTISDINIFIFKTGIGFYVYEASLPQNKNVETGYVNKLNLNQLVLFQNRFKELNVVRGYLAKGENKYCFYPKGYDENEFYTLGREIALKLQTLLEDVFYYPPRVNTVLKYKKLDELKNKKKEMQERKEKINKKKFEKKEAFWKNLMVSDQKKFKEEELEDIFIVPDKAILYSYVVMNANNNLLSGDEKEEAIALFCKNLYYLTRGYKHSYRVSEGAFDERNQMFRRHENDFWDASLEGAGDFVLLYDNLYERSLDDAHNDKKQKTSLFFDAIRPLEMRGDYFILYMLLLYEHYSVVFFSKKIAETIPMQKEAFLNVSNDNDMVYQKLRDLKLDVNMFFTNCMFEAVSQITDLCTIYTFIEGKMDVKKNRESLQRGINDLDTLCKEIQTKKKEEKDLWINRVVSTIGILAIVSIFVDAVQLVDLIVTYAIPFIVRIWNAIIIWHWMYRVILAIAILGIVFYFLRRRRSRKFTTNKNT